MTKITKTVTAHNDDQVNIDDNYVLGVDWSKRLFLCYLTLPQDTHPSPASKNYCKLLREGGTRINNMYIGKI